MYIKTKLTRVRKSHHESIDENGRVSGIHVCDIYICSSGRTPQRRNAPK